MTYQPIETYGLIGDMHSIALVSERASIDYLCLPHFDSPSVFAALLDEEKGGRFQIAPSDPERRKVRQFYAPDTNILMTRFLSEDGVAEVIDFMPTADTQHAHRVVRLVKGVRGKVPFELLCEPAFDYARAEHRLKLDGNQALFQSEGADRTTLRLHSGAALAATEKNGACASFTVEPGDSLSFVLEVAPKGASIAEQPGYAEKAFDVTLRYWRHWMGQCGHDSRWTAALNRSALAIKLLTSKHYGAIAAAATFGLPEGLGGERNWDYRYTWIRDGSLTASCLIDLGYRDEPRAFTRWLRDRLAASEDGKLQIMFGTDGRKDLHEELLDHLSGYRDSRPVRIGNGAYDQLQLDIYGEMMLFLERCDAEVEPMDLELWSDVVRSVNWTADNWDRVDEGVWEVRGGRQRFLYSRLMDWVALDRALKIAARRSLPAPEHWTRVRDTIHREINERFWDPKQKVYVQYRDSTTLDASCLLMPIVGFVSPRDPRWLSTLDAIGRDLVDDSLVYRYRTDDAASDGLKGTEGTFSMCTFWYVDCLARAGRLEEARLIFEKMLHYASPLGLWGEELGHTGEHLGNYPQAFTHLGLVGAARSLDAALDATEGRVFRA